MKRGVVFQALATFPAGLDQYAMFTVFENGDSWAEIVAFDYRGGDATEVYQMLLCPPNQIQDGNNAPADVPGCVAVFGGMTGGDGSVDVPAPYQNRGPVAFESFAVPPNWSLALQNATATNANAVVLNILMAEMTD